MKESDKINSSSHSLKGGGIQFSPMIMKEELQMDYFCHLLSNLLTKYLFQDKPQEPWENPAKGR
jgi:hypothetical protein